MEERRSLGSMEKGGFGTSVSFDIDEMEAPLGGMEAEIRNSYDVGPPDVIAAFDGARNFLHHFVTRSQ